MFLLSSGYKFAANLVYDCFEAIGEIEIPPVMLHFNGIPDFVNRSSSFCGFASSDEKSLNSLLYNGVSQPATLSKLATSFVIHFKSNSNTQSIGLQELVCQFVNHFDILDHFSFIKRGWNATTK